MNKTQARNYLKRIREAVRDAEAALTAGDAEALQGALNEISGSTGEIDSALNDTYGDGLGLSGMGSAGAAAEKSYSIDGREETFKIHKGGCAHLRRVSEYEKHDFTTAETTPEGVIAAAHVHFNGATEPQSFAFAPCMPKAWQ
jgi:Zn-dependent protease with chaperone function